MGLELVLHRGGEDGATGTDGDHRGQVVVGGTVVERLGQGARHGVADDEERHAPLGLSEPPRGVRIEAAGGRQRHVAPAEERDEHSPLGCSVHDRGEHEGAQRGIRR